MVHVQTGHGLDVVIDGESIGLLKRGDYQVLWLEHPESLLEVLAAEVKRLKRTSAVNGESDDVEG